MDMKPGFKLTEVGMIAEDWVIYKIGEAMRLINGRAFRPDEWKDHGLPIIRIQNLNNAEAQFNFFSGAIEDKHKVEPGNLLFAWSGTKGTSFGARIWNGPAGVLNQHIFKVIPDQRKITPSYTFRVLGKVQESIEKQAHGFKASFVHVKKSDLVAVQLPIPPTTAEQEAIAKALSDADALIESLEQLLAKKRHIKQGAMQELLTGKKRLPGFTGKWVEVALGVMGKCHRGVSYNPTVDLSPSDGPSTIRLLRSNNVQDAAIVLADIQYVASERVSENQRLYADDILICMANGSRNLVGKAGRFLINDGFQYTFGAFMGCFRPHKEKVNPEFCFYLFHTEKYRLHIELLLAGSSINNLTPSSVEALINKVPFDRNEQAAIATILSDIDDELVALEAKLAKARQIKQSMMAELLTGKIRLV